MSNKLWEKRRLAFRDAIKEAREKAGLTQKTLADELGKYQSYVSKYESGERRLDYIEVLEILDACDLSVDGFQQLYLKNV